MKKISLIKLFLTFFKINAVTFGGGYTIVPVIKDVFVNDYKLLSEDEMLDILALAQGGPGAMAISTSILTGYKLRGVAGALTTLSASVLPCLIILSTVSIFYSKFRTNFFVNAILDGISGVICAVLLLTVYNMGSIAYKKYPGFSSIVMILIFILGFFLKVKTSHLILLCAVLGISIFFVIDRRYHG
ncbi:chromate transporter [Peptoniphilus mikwangii]|uniref:chromate transporter n=1 Tax=Peptoniphilus mikwangii TaxID=1354300 RepID=UPI0003FA4A07|nr:chromate transporter [Peptoniphilus mikwangii]